MAFGHKLDRLISVHLVWVRKNSATNYIVTLDELAEMVPDKRTKSDFERHHVTEYQIWECLETGDTYTVLPDLDTKQEMLARIEVREERDKLAVKMNQAARAARRYVPRPEGSRKQYEF